LNNGRSTPSQSGGKNNSLGRAIRYLWKHPRISLTPYLFLLVAAGSQLAIPAMIKNVIDAVTRGVTANYLVPYLDKIPANVLPLLMNALGTTQGQLIADATDAEQMLLRAGGAILILAAVRAVFAFLQAYTAERSSQTVAFDLRNELYAKIQGLSFSYHDRNQTGQLMVRATDDVEKLRLFIGQGLLQLVYAVVLFFGTLAILFSTNARLTLVVLPMLPVALALFFLFNKYARPMFTQVQVRLSAMNTVLQENLAGIKVIKAFTREQSEKAKFDAAALSVMDQQISLARLFAFLFPLMFLIGNLGQAAVQYFGGVQIIGGTLTVGEWQEFSMYLVFLIMPITLFGFIITQMSQASASAIRIFEILDASSDVVDKPGAIQLPPVEGRVVFNHVTFRYFGSGDPVLRDISFIAQPGQTIALLGATGSGKTTIINLLPRFYDPSEGSITIDRHDLRDVTLESLRSQIGIVLQETTLFTGTIRDNIAFGRPDASIEAVMAAARAAAAHDFIMSFPQGYDTPVGERGTTLSGGQKQRIAIARALLLDPRILILDDSTSSVDLATEIQIQKALDKLMLDRTSFVIAQRISTVMNADQILVLDKGQIVGRGKHEELLEENEIYADIYHSQLVGDAGGENSAEEEAEVDTLQSA
jgi:ATP-binding cassette subfamily B multidrug efflux pump